MKSKASSELILDITEKQLNQLAFACEYHNRNGVETRDVTIQTCWDSDRLDLFRVGIIPDESLLSTDFSKKQETIDHCLVLYEKYTNNLKQGYLYKK